MPLGSSLLHELLLLFPTIQTIRQFLEPCPFGRDQRHAIRPCPAAWLVCRPLVDPQPSRCRHDLRANRGECDRGASCECHRPTVPARRHHAIRDRRSLFRSVVLGVFAGAGSKKTLVRPSVARRQGFVLQRRQGHAVSRRPPPGRRRPKLSGGCRCSTSHEGSTGDLRRASCRGKGVTPDQI